jgi:hypothetical protein
MTTGAGCVTKASWRLAIIAAMTLSQYQQPRTSSAAWLTIAVATLSLLGTFATAPGPEGDAQPSYRQFAWVLDQLGVHSEQSNLCNGGLENGKRIVAEPYLRNPMHETTRLGCEVDGGNPIQVPDLPAPDDRATRLA